MNHAKLETYRIFDASIVPVCTGGLRVPDSGFRALFTAKNHRHDTAAPRRRVGEIGTQDVFWGSV